MKYFSLFEIPISLKVDASALLKQYYKLSRQYHPDNFTLADASAREESEQMTALINEAKRVLDSPDKRLAYILKENNIIEEDEKYVLPPSFLGEMMDINEQLMELELEQEGKNLSMIKAEIGAIEANMFKQVEHFFKQDILNFSNEEAALLKAYYYKKKYLQRIMERLS